VKEPVEGTNSYLQNSFLGEKHDILVYYKNDMSTRFFGHINFHLSSYHDQMHFIPNTPSFI